MMYGKYLKGSIWLAQHLRASDKQKSTKRKETTTAGLLCPRGHLFLQHDNYVSSKNTQLHVIKALEGQSCRQRQVLFVALPPLYGTRCPAWFNTETEPNMGKRWSKGIIFHGFTFRPAHCVDEDVVLVDLVLVMLELLLQVQQLLVGKLSGAFCLLDRWVRFETGLPSVLPRDRKPHKYTPCSTVYLAWDHQRCPPPSHRGPSESCFPLIECLFSHPSHT